MVTAKRYSDCVAGFTKLFSTIVHSTVWREEMHVKVVWVTMLALANRDGIVEASVPGLADASRVSVPQCRDALKRLSSPDEDSRTKTYEGRRIEEVDGGWRLFNYLKYRELRSREEERIKTRVRVAEHRERKRSAVTVTPSNKKYVPLRHSEEEADADSKQRTTDCGPAAPAAVEVASKPWTKEACDDWTARFGGTAPGGRIGKALKPLVEKHAWSEVRPSWRSYLEQSEAEFASAERFASTYGRWSGSSQPAVGRSAPNIAQQNRKVSEEWAEEVKAGKR